MQDTAIEEIVKKIEYECDEYLYGEDIRNKIIYQKINNAVKHLQNNALRIKRGDMVLIEPYLSSSKTKDILQKIYEVLLKTSMIREKEQEIEDILGVYLINASKIFVSNPSKEAEYKRCERLLDGLD